VVGRLIYMGGHFWSYSVPYQKDIRAALEALREQEFRAGRFWQPAEVEPGFFGRLLDRGPSKPKRPASIPEALKISDATGTRSILDMERVTDTPELGAVSPLQPQELRELFGTEQPTLETIEKSEAFIDRLERGQGVYIILHEQGKPEKIYFAGYSYD
jgi:hypothetical protein